MSLRLLPVYAFVACVSITLTAENLCPRNIAGLPMRIVENSLIVVPIRVNDRGPYNFLVDTGAQISTVDSTLASELHLQIQGTAGVSGAITHSRRNLAILDLVAAGKKSVAGLAVVIQDLSQLKAVDPHISGILGDNFLERFDLLIDNRHKLFCLDDTKALALAAGGEHIPLIDPYGPSTDLPFTKPILIAAANPALGTEPLKLRLDSGTNVAMLHRANPQVSRLVSAHTPTLHHVVEGIEQVFAILPRSDLAIGNHRLHDLSFVVPADPARDIPAPREDGILPTSGFQSVFISPSGQYAIVETW